MMEKAIIAKNITKKYKLYNGTRERIFDLITPRSYGEDFYALENISFEANRGDTVGFIGINGSGKSTLSNIVAGIVPETLGTVKVYGQTSIIAVAAGLKNELTGRDNIELKCLMLGFNKQEIKELEPAIIEFSELGKFIDQPVKSYSSGMKSRLGFAISVNVDPDILIIDEALSVGDKAFAEKSLTKMKEFKKNGKTMIFVSHSIGQMKQFCEKILWLEFGKVKEFGSVEDVIPKYESFLKVWQIMSKKEREAYKQMALEEDQDSIDQLINNMEKPLTEMKSTSKEEPISLLAHIKGGNSFIYSTPGNLSTKRSTDKYKNSVYFVKRQIKYNDELFYLLSIQPSGEEGVIGWMNSSDLSSHIHIAVDNDKKMFTVIGTGSGYDNPWGGSKNYVFKDLTPMAQKDFKVNKTDLVGKNLWYRGKIDDQQVWIHTDHLTEKQ